MKKIAFALLIGSFASFTSFAQTKINIEESKYHIGENVVVCGKVFSGRYLQTAKNKPTLLNVGGHYPNQLLTVVVFDDDRKYFNEKLEDFYNNMNVCITGKMQEYRGMPEIIIRSPEQIVLDNGSARSNSVPAINKSSTASTAKKAEPKTAAKPLVQKEVPVVATPKKILSTSEQYDIKLSNDVNLRIGPGTDNPIATMLTKGSVVTVLNSENGWSYVHVKFFSKEQNQPVDFKGYIKNDVLQ